MHKLSERHKGESPKITLRMDPGMLRAVDKEARGLKGDRSAAIRSLIERATGAGITAAVGGAIVAQEELRELKARLEKVESERDEAIAQRKAADHGAKRTMEAWAEARKELDAALARAREAIDSRYAATKERDEATAKLSDAFIERDEARAEVERLRTELEQERKVSEGRRETLLKKSDELRAEWLRAERAEGEVSRLKTELDALKTARRIIAETPAEIVRETAQSDDTARNTALRARWKALSIPLRTFVTKYGITRTPFQKWAAGERDMHGETLGKYEAAIGLEE